MLGQMLEIPADHIMNHHMVSGGRRPLHIMCPASIFSICLRMYFLCLPHIAFSALGPHCIFVWTQYCIVFLGRLGPNIHVFSGSLKHAKSFFHLCGPVDCTFKTHMSISDLPYFTYAPHCCRICFKCNHMSSTSGLVYFLHLLCVKEHGFTPYI